MKTYMARKEDIKRKWYVVDVEGKTLGRVATEIARVLMGKHKPEYTPHLDMGDFVIAINADKFVVTGKKMVQKMYRRHSGYPGGLKEQNLKELLSRHPERVLEYAVRGMLPKNKLRSRRMKRLRIYCSPDHPHKAQKPEKLNI